MGSSLPISIEILTPIMQYTVGILLASVPAIIWGYLFFKKDKDSRRTLGASFLGGIFSVLPIMLYMSVWGTSFGFLGKFLPNINIFSFLQNLVVKKDLASFGEFLFINVLVALGFFVILALLVGIVRLIFVKESRKAIASVIGRAFETPMHFLLIGIIVSLVAFFADFSIERAIWYFILVGAMEEFVKFLVLRFLDDGNYKGIDDVILQSVMIALGFAFFENIIYFVDKIWLSACSISDISAGICLQNPVTQVYTKQIGVLLMPFIFRSLFSTVAHVIFSSIFGYFYGLAYFKKLSDEEKEAEEGKTSVFWSFFTFKKAFHWEKMLFLGLVIAMGIHALFNIILEWNMIYLIVPFLAGGYLLIDYLIGVKHALKNQGVLDEDLKVAPTFGKLMRNIGILKEFEDKLKGQVEFLEKRKATEHLEEKVTALEKFEEHIREDERKKNKIYMNPQEV